MNAKLLGESIMKVKGENRKRKVGGGVRPHRLVG